MSKENCTRALEPIKPCSEPTAPRRGTAPMQPLHKQTINKHTGTPMQFTPPPLRTYHEIPDSDPQYKQKVESTCRVLREHILEDFKLAFGDTLQDLVKQNTPAKEPIRLYRKQSDKPPANYITVRPIEINIADKDKKYIDELLATGIISTCRIPTESCAQARFISKSDGQVRLVVDYRSVNLTMKRTGYPLTPTSKTLQKI